MEQMGKEFFLTLPSWTSDTLFPHNKAGDYYVKLPKPLNLYGEWKVGMVNVLVPKSWYNITEHMNYINVTQYGDNVPTKVTIPYGRYESVNEVIVELNKSLTVVLPNQEIYFGYDNRRKKAYVSIESGAYTLSMPRSMSGLLGFTYGEVMNRSQYAQGQPNLEMTNEFVVINCDIVEEQIVGNLKSPMLGYLYARDVQYGESLRYTVDTQYLRLRNKAFEVIHIWMTDLAGNQIEFIPTKTLVQLHFYR